MPSSSIWLISSATPSTLLTPGSSCLVPDRTSRCGLYAPEWNTNEQRPGMGAVCTSHVQAGLYVDTWSYNSAGSRTLIGTTLSSDQPLLIVATAFDGTVATAVETPTSSLPGSSASETTGSGAPTATESVKSTSTESGSTAVLQLSSCGVQSVLCGLVILSMLIHLF
ncbi:hypothetical protein PWT90_02537 [Aphanocladium album]|nr:hypothetical protein PWT90_02537 [Aphanocladium album]